MWVHLLVTFPRAKEKAKVIFFDLVGFCVVALKNEEAILSKAAK